MITLQKEQLPQILDLYNQGQSVREISEKFDVSLDAMFYFFRKYNIVRRNASDRNKAFFERKQLSFCIKEKLSLEEEKLKVAGIMLYWGEGSQWSGEKIVDFANSKPEMIKIFLLIKMRKGLGEMTKSYALKKLMRKCFIMDG